MKIPPKEETLRPCGALEVNLLRSDQSNSGEIYNDAQTDQSQKRSEGRPFEFCFFVVFFFNNSTSGNFIVIIRTSCHKFCIVAVEFTREISNGVVHLTA